eukprot:TRINITY_DN2262_c0_g1::TRINITY_DN2262_c0_g1_i1::g.6819::m.6819 TRINITY_DN2262_c0_g1::TRINITY_DN2262_c0_g1_i1::g.6819  ORF type:complete len:154 (+),score=47.54,sp/P19984/PROF2_ACACA/34.85/1e-18,Profilin/PF00235.14/3.4e-24 TRINITY_DN2262_c0_g1_i1:72-464(+)
MGWDSYIASLTAQGVSSGAILGHDGSVWAKSANLEIPSALGVVQATTKGDASTLQAGGFKLILDGQEVKFMFLRNDADSKSVFLRKGATGVVAYATAQAVVLGYHNESIQQAACVKQVSYIADYLTSLGY